ncbi:MAG TPA: VOC family protein [Xanthobacteraceae bacterium]|nr:VOC family protein [Xanthobacteraceae bacterium]
MANSHGRFVWYELMTTDMEAAMAFYTKVMGWGAWDASMPGRAYILFSAGPASVGGLMDLPQDARETGVKPSWIGYVGVDDVDATADRIERLGGAVHVPPTDIAATSRFAIFTDPQTARLALFKWLKPGQQQPAEPGALGRVGWHELLAADVETAWDFYGEVFGWQKGDADVAATGTYQLFSAGGQTIGGMLTKPAITPEPFWLFYFTIGDIDAATARVKAGGGQVVHGPVETPDGRWIAQCMDPQGALFALQGKRSPAAVGYFEGGAARGPADAPGRRWSW